MILDSSAIIAILADEPGAGVYIRAISNALDFRISAANFVEISLVLESQFAPQALQQCDALFRRANITIEPVSVEQAHLARQAFHDFGKGRHPAGLNFGDCFAYALAKQACEPLLFKGNDFSKTDIAPALPPA